MNITLDPQLEARLRTRAEVEGVSVDAYIERLLRAEQAAEGQLEALLLEGVNSGDPIEATPEFWAERHRQLDEQLKTRSA